MHVNYISISPVKLNLDVQTSFDKLRRLGLRPDTEKMARQRKPLEIGMLVVHKTLKGGPAHGKLEEGDVLINIQGTFVTSFVEMEEMFDESVGKSVNISIYRGGVAQDVDIVVQDLHTITPAEFAEYSGGIFHQVSYQISRSFDIECKGVFCASVRGRFPVSHNSHAHTTSTTSRATRLRWPN